jgi:hypothetical protein
MCHVCTNTQALPLRGFNFTEVSDRWERPTAPMYHCSFRRAGIHRTTCTHHTHRTTRRRRGTCEHRTDCAFEVRSLHLRKHRHHLSHRKGQLRLTGKARCGSTGRTAEQPVTASHRFSVDGPTTEAIPPMVATDRQTFLSASTTLCSALWTDGPVDEPERRRACLSLRSPPAPEQAAAAPLL